MKDLVEAQRVILSLADGFGEETVPLASVYGRVLAENIYADRAYPPFHRAAMDGYAIRFADFMESGIRTFTVIGEIFAGDDFHLDSINAGESVKIMTGAPTPSGFDAIIRVEDSRGLGNGKVQFSVESIKKSQNIAKMGEDNQLGTLVLPKGTQLLGPEMGALATVGKAEVCVEKLPNIALFSTGNEVKSVSDNILPYQIRDSNRHALDGFLKKYHCQVSILGILKDEKEAIRLGLSQAENVDVIILTGGVSAGDADFVPSVFRELGFEELFHKVKIKPGKPFWLGRKGKTTVFALPGNPMSCQVGFKLFIEPFLRQCFGMVPYPVFPFPLAGGRPKKVGLDEFFPCVWKGNALEEVKINGSGDIRAAVGSLGLAKHPAAAGDLESGSLVEFFFW